MGAALDALVVVYGHDAELDIMLRVRLADVYDIEISRAATKLWMVRIIISLIRRRYPDGLAIGIGAKRLVVKIDIELPQLPQMKSDVFACISHGAVRAHDHFVGFVF